MARPPEASRNLRDLRINYSHCNCNGTPLGPHLVGRGSRMKYSVPKSVLSGCWMRCAAVFAGLLAGVPGALYSQVNLQPIIEARLNDHATVGLAYSRQFVASHRANGSYQCCFSSQHTWSLAVSSGPLPVGFSISSSGLLQGTATAVQTGRYPLTLQTTDPSGQTAFQNFEFWVDPAPVVAINSGGTTAVGRFTMDGFIGSVEGNARGLPGSTTAVVDTAGLFNPPPPEIFQTYR